MAILQEAGLPWRQCYAAVEVIWRPWKIHGQIVQRDSASPLCERSFSIHTPYLLCDGLRAYYNQSHNSYRNIEKHPFFALYTYCWSEYVEIAEKLSFNPTFHCKLFTLNIRFFIVNPWNSFFKKIQYIQSKIDNHLPLIIVLDLLL